MRLTYRPPGAAARRRLAASIASTCCVNWRMSHALRAHDEKAEIRYADFRNEVLVLGFRNNRSMASCCIIDFVMPRVDDWLAIDVADEGRQALLEFVFGSDADVAQY